MTDPRFQGLVAVVTGGLSGIGAATADRLRELGATVVVLDRTADPSDPGALAVDIADADAVTTAVDEIAATHGRIDILVNSAGVGAAGTVTQNDVTEWRRVLDINVIGTANVIRACLPQLIASPTGSVVNVASAVATTGFPNRVLYTASKGAVLSMTRAMAADHLGDGIRFNAVCPGTTETAWIGRLLDSAEDPAAARTALETRQPHGRLVTADEVAEAIAYLAGPRSGSTNGTTVSVDGGIDSLYVSR
ncbi:short-chain dehydrogenase [Enemella evansiae]|uniref:SDR family NAD(P)-dependent oxidoreductase n=1 Tax=Enemella evansiae TaxID=2016499 RepID=UPI000B967A01|nr:SDR family oxidoreductase [Enemella evansiae]OYN99053.1 short-chain dehydrogenase [Enemella evansiae]OYO00005.1 short-chain dehydrogenase [Enemella evansiae]